MKTWWVKHGWTIALLAVMVFAYFQDRAHPVKCFSVDKTTGQLLLEE